MSKKYVVIGVQPIEHRTTIFAESEEQALKKAEEGHTAYDWEEVNIGDWKYEILEEEDDEITNIEQMN
jgi:hypothetical protein